MNIIISLFLLWLVVMLVLTVIWAVCALLVWLKDWCVDAWKFIKHPVAWTQIVRGTMDHNDPFWKTYKG